MNRDSEKNKKNPKGTFPDVHGGKKLEPVFSKQLRAELTKLRKFRKPDGKIVTHSYVELLVQKIMDQLLNSPEMDTKLLEMMLNRLEGKVAEGIDLSGDIEIRRGLSAKELLLQKLGRHVQLRESEKSD